MLALIIVTKVIDGQIINRAASYKDACVVIYCVHDDLLWMELAAAIFQSV